MPGASGRQIRKAWIDANAVIYFLTGQPPELAEPIYSVMRQAQEGKVILQLASLTVAEVVWVLESALGRSRAEISDLLLDFVRAEAIHTQEEDVLFQALVDYRNRGVDFVDAYLAAHARAAGSPTVLTFDRDFDRLNVEKWVPG